MATQHIHTLRPATLKPGARIPTGAESTQNQQDQPAGGSPGQIISGKALILWDPARPGHKLDAIDTDQITPAKDCVSESLDALDEKWKAGSFRFLMPDYRERVHRGETFLIAGDRFAIGSSREMSPAGLKAIAEEVGLQMVIVCGDNMGDIFRRNSFNLGLEVVQCPAAVADAADNDDFTYDPKTRALVNTTQNKCYEPFELSVKENEIRQTGGIFAMGRREFPASIDTKPVIEWPDAATAARLTTTEQIVWAHRVNKQAEVRPGETLRVYTDLLPGSDGTAPFAIHTFNQITGGNTIDPRQAAIANDHFVFTGKQADEHQTAIGRKFAQQQGIKKPYYSAPGDGIFHFYFPEQGLVLPGAFIPGADSHSRAYGAYGAVGMGVGSTTLGFGWSTGYIYFTPAPARRVTFTGRLQPWVSGKDIVLELLRRWGTAQSQGMSVEMVDADKQLPMHYRNTICNMMAEGEAQNGIFAADETTYDWYREKGMTNLPYPSIQPGADVHYEIDEQIDLSSVVPMVAKPYSPGNAHPATDVAGEHISIDKAFIGSCTNGSYEDLLQAAQIIRAAREQGGRDSVAIEFVILPGSNGVKQRIEDPDPRLGDESIASVLRSVGGQIRESWCGPCFGQGPDALAAGQSAITTFNRNWKNRMGVGGEGYLASPAIVAASALLGYIAPPSALGVDWDPAIFKE
jgi:3-isopropylmalate/(R)-2-methylmalate dehydratase large subunit